MEERLRLVLVIYSQHRSQWVKRKKLTCDPLDKYLCNAGGVRPMIAKHAGHNRKTAHSYQHRRRVHIKLLR